MKQALALLISWGPIGVFLLAVLDSAGIPVPGGVDALVILTAAARPESATITALIAIVGSMLGCMILFWISRKGGQVYLERNVPSEKALRFRRWFDHYGLLTVFIPALIPIPLPLKVFVISAGALGTSPLSFLAVIAAARIPRYFALAYLASHLGADTVPWLKQHAWHLTGIALALFLALYLMVRAKDRQLQLS